MRGGHSANLHTSATPCGATDAATGTNEMGLFPLHHVCLQQYRGRGPLLPRETAFAFWIKSPHRQTHWLMGKQEGHVSEQPGPAPHLLGQGLLQGRQGRVRVGRVSLQGLDSLFQAAHLLLLVSELLLKIFNLSVQTHLRGGGRK